MPKATKEMTYEDERASLDKARPSKSRVWPNKGMRFYSGWDENKRLRAVVCSTEDQAIQVFGDHVEVILMTLGHYEPEDKVVWDAPGVEFIQTGFGPTVWKKSSEMLVMAKDLLPCPWCGGTDIYADASEICCPIQWSAVAKCRNCGAQEPDGSGVHNLKEDAEREALAAWNVRLTGG